jgi:hypothetical protein
MKLWMEKTEDDFFGGHSFSVVKYFTPYHLSEEKRRQFFDLYERIADYEGGRNFHFYIDEDDKLYSIEFTDMGGENIMVRVEEFLSRETINMEWDDILEFMFNFIMRRI